MILDSEDTSDKDGKNNEDKLQKQKESDDEKSIENPNSVDKNDGDILIKSPALERIIKQEGTHCKPASLIMVPIILIGMVILTLLRGNSRVDSIVGIGS